MRTYSKFPTPVLVCAALVFGTGCGHYLIPGHFQPKEVNEQQAAGKVAQPQPAEVPLS